MVYYLAPNPGSVEAIRLGCICPVMENSRGAGYYTFRDGSRPLFLLNDNCHVHASRDHGVNETTSILS